MPARIIFCLNSGSSTRKFALYAFDNSIGAMMAQGGVERGEGLRGRLWVTTSGRKFEREGDSIFEPHAALEAAFSAMAHLDLPSPDAAGHRIVHGGPDHEAPERISDALIANLRSLIPFAPLHLPDELAGIEAIAALAPGLPQVACFDTAFHRAMPEVAERFALPRGLFDEGIRRYGFHGISYEYIMETLGDNPPRRLIIAHLGSGASMVAVRDGRSLDTTMGFSPTGGFMMGTRSGDLDPGVILYLLNHKHLAARALERLVNDESGLFGVSGVTADMKTLLDRSHMDSCAAQAIEMFCYQARKQVGALAAALGGLDMLVFTGGIGEKAALVRAEICNGLAHLGVVLDARKNQQNADTISATDGCCIVRVIPTNEDLMIARHVYSTLYTGVPHD
jgi:acetate kinase